MSAHLPSPMRDLLQEPFDDASLARLWPAVERRRGRVNAWIPRWSVALAGLAAVALVVAVAWPRHAPTMAGPLRLATGAVVVPVESAHGVARVVFDDRSRLTLAEGARVAPQRNDAHAFDTTLVHGRARFDVTPHGPRRWTIDCGLATVRVVGTSFTLDRSPARLHVEVHHGLVRVDGDRVPGHTRVLGAGESLDVFVEPVTVSVPAPEAPVAPTPAVVAVRTAPRASEAWRALAARREFVAAWDALGPGGVAARARDASTDDQLALAEVAHRSRHYAEAATLYARFVAEHPGHAQSGMVAFTLGRIQLDQLAAPGDAARSFERALRLGAPRDLQEDVHARRVEALARAGDASGAREAAAAYERAFPDGRRAADVRRWVR